MKTARRTSRVNPPIKLTDAMLRGLEVYVFDPAHVEEAAFDDEGAVEAARAILENTRGKTLNAPSDETTIWSWHTRLSYASESAMEDGEHGDAKALNNLAGKLVEILRGPRANPRANPKLGKHADLFQKERVSATQIDEMPAETDVFVEDWRTLTPTELRNAAANGDLSDEDYEDMEAYEEQADADGDIDALLKDGLSRATANAVAAGLKKELMDLDEDSRERRAEPFITYMREGMMGSLEMEYGDEDGENIQNEGAVDSFQSDLEHDLSIDGLRTAAVDQSELAADIIENGKLDDEHIDEVLRDPNIYDIKRVDDEYRNVSGSVWSWACGRHEDQRDGGEKTLNAILHGGEYTHHAWGPAQQAHARGEPAEGLRGRAFDEEVVYPGMTDGDVQYALKELLREEPYVEVDVSYQKRGKFIRLDSSNSKDLPKFTVDSFDDGYTLTSSFYESSRIHAIVNTERLDEALQAKIEEFGGAPAKVGPEHDDVVYRYSGTNDSVAGASARNMYVARLQPRDLRKEGSTQGICIGREENGHPKALREGKTRVFSIRTEAGKPKFTIEMAKEYMGTKAPGAEDQWRVAEVKGKANRLAGFEAGKETFTKPDDLRLVTDFLLSLGYTAEYLKTVRDIAPGIKAMEQTGADPFAPPPKRVRPHRDPRTLQPNPAGYTSPAVRRLLAKTKPMGTFRG